MVRSPLLVCVRFNANAVRRCVEAGPGWFQNLGPPVSFLRASASMGNGCGCCCACAGATAPTSASAPARQRARRVTADCATGDTPSRLPECLLRLLLHLLGHHVLWEKDRLVRRPERQHVGLIALRVVPVGRGVSASRMACSSTSWRRLVGSVGWGWDTDDLLHGPASIGAVARCPSHARKIDDAPRIRPWLKRLNCVIRRHGRV